MKVVEAVAEPLFMEMSTCIPEPRESMYLMIGTRAPRTMVNVPAAARVDDSIDRWRISRFSEVSGRSGAEINRSISLSSVELQEATLTKYTYFEHNFRRGLRPPMAISCEFVIVVGR